MYSITFSAIAKEGLAKLKRNEPNSFKKAQKLLIAPNTRDRSS